MARTKGCTAAASRPARCRGDGAAALVEFAILLPFLAIIVFGTIDFGRYYQAWNQTKNAAREGALYAERFPNQQRPGSGACANPDNVEYKAKQELAENSADATFTVTIEPAVPTCNPTPAPIVPGDTVTVTVSRHVELITPIAQAIIGDVDITASVEAKVQG